MTDFFHLMSVAANISGLFLFVTCGLSTPLGKKVKYVAEIRCFNPLLRQCV